jgi:pimeloyl-ACP methyl ester carboxylesterase
MATRDELLEIAVDDQHIAGTLIAPAAAVPGVLFVHGWGGSQQQYLARGHAVAGLGCVCLTFDLRGHARSDAQRETVSRDHNLRDLLAAYDTLARHPGVDASAIGVIGSSYGGYLGAILTSLRSVRWLALRAPALYKDAGWELPKRALHQDPDFAAYRRRPVSPEENRALGACAAFRGDVLIVESEHDNVVPHPVIASYIAACAQARSLTTRLIEGADHGLTEQSWQRAYTSLLINWLVEMVIGAINGSGT